MQRSKKIFIALSAVFLIIMIIIGYDISRRTTFPGSKTDKDVLQSEEINIDSLDISAK